MNQLKKRVLNSMFIPSLFLLLMWSIKFIEYFLNFDLYFLGIYPLKIKGLIGIITSPFIHSNFEHLLSNSFPLLILGTGIFYFYRKVAYRVFFIIYFATGLWVWFFARQSYHIGASGLVYGYASFLFFSGIILKHKQLLSISLLVAFLYGGMVWGIFPLKVHISWESHLMGFVAGIVFAFYYKNEFVENNKFINSQERSDVEYSEFHGNSNITNQSINFEYYYKEDD